MENQIRNLEKDVYEKFINEFADYCYDDDEGLKLNCFYKYGPLTEQYWSTSPRILVCNLEAYGDNDNIIEFNFDYFVDNWLKKVKGYNAKTATRTSKFIWGLLTAINGEEVEINDFINLNEKAYISSIKNVAYLNLRVDENIGTSTKAEYGKIREQFNETKGYLKDQIEKLNPQIIIISSKLGCELFNTCFNDCNLYYQTVKKWDYKVVCSIKHFSRSSNKEFYDSIRKIVSIFND